MDWAGVPVLLSTTGAVLLLYLGCYCIYNIHFHPLSRYPGPWYMSASDLPRLVLLLQGRYVSYNHVLHSKYGEVVRVGPNELSFINGQAWKDIYGHGTGDFVKDPNFYGKTPNGVDHIGTANRADHCRMRSAFSYAFSERALRQQEPLLHQYADKLVSKMREKLDKNLAAPINMVDMYNFTTFDIMSALTFGEPLNLLETTAYTPWVRALFQGVKFMTIRGALNKIPVVSQLLELLVSKTLKGQFEAHFDYASSLVNRRLSWDVDARSDIWSFVLRHDGKRALSLAEMHSNASGFMIGGSETTATSLSGMTYFLLKNPRKLRKLQDEIRLCHGKNEDISWTALARLEYLNACMWETLRLYPPAAVGLPRIVPQEGAKICGKGVPGGTVVYVSQYAANHSPLNFRRPDEFIPERWISREFGFANDRRDVYQPFSHGPRNCIGMNLAYHETRLLISKVLLHFDLALSDEKFDWLDQRVYITWEKHPLMVRLRHVDARCA